jgi:predicted transcriptional regulator
VSPVYDEKADADILKVLRDNNLSPETDLSALITEAEQLKAHIDEVSASIADDEKRYKVLADQIKQASIEQFRDGDKSVTIAGAKYDWVTSRTVSKKLDEDAMKADGVYDKYKTKESVTFRFTPKERKE